MVWQDKQKAVVSDCAILLETPMAPQKIGRKKRSKKARIFPPRVVVMLGRATSTAISAAVSRARLTIKVVAGGIGSSPYRAMADPVIVAGWLFRCQRADIRH